MDFRTMLSSLLSIYLLTYIVLPSTHAITCYNCTDTGVSIGSTCLGSRSSWRTCIGNYCYLVATSITISSLTANAKIRLCTEVVPPGLQLNRCVLQTIQGYPSSSCICSTDRCNIDEATAGGGRPPLPSITTTPSTGTTTCYDCIDTGYDYGTTCKGSRYSWPTCRGNYCRHITATVTASGITLTTKTRSCIGEMPGGYQLNGCVTQTISGHPVSTCFCSTDRCNIDEATAGGGLPPSQAVTTTGSTVSITCYDCINTGTSNTCEGSRSTWRTCQGKYCVLITTTILVSGITVITKSRSCNAELPGGYQLNRCVPQTVAGFPASACICSVDRCNIDEGVVIQAGGGQQPSTTTARPIPITCYNCIDAGAGIGTICPGSRSSWPICRGNYCVLITTTRTDTVKGIAPHTKNRFCSSIVPAGYQLNRCVPRNVGGTTASACICSANRCNEDEATVAQAATATEGKGKAAAGRPYSSAHSTIILISCIVGSMFIFKL